MKELVLDTNVLVSGMLSPRQPPGQIVDLLRAGVVRLVVDDRILREYRTVLRRPVFDRYLTADARNWIIAFLEAESRREICVLRWRDLPDPSDACFLEVASASGCPLVTGNLKHFPEERRGSVTVMTPREFIDGVSGP